MAPNSSDGLSLIIVDYLALLAVLALIALLALLALLELLKLLELGLGLGLYPSSS